MKFAKPPKDVVWLHVDRFDRKDEKVWAVQYWKGKKHIYLRASHVLIQRLGVTTFFGATAPQPRGVIEFRYADVTVIGKHKNIVKIS